MKKYILMTMLTCFIGVFASCGNVNPQTTSISQTAEDDTLRKEVEGVVDEEENEESTSSKSNKDVNEVFLEENQQSQILLLQETRNAQYEEITGFEKYLDKTGGY